MLVRDHAGKSSASVTLPDQNDVHAILVLETVEDVLPRLGGRRANQLQLRVLPSAQDDLVGDPLLVTPRMAEVPTPDAPQLVREAPIVHQA